jgi:transposase
MNTNGELYTVLTNRDRHGRKDCLAAIVAGTKPKDVIAALRKKMPGEALDKVEEVTLDLLESMSRIVKACFPKTSQVIDRFHRE